MPDEFGNPLPGEAGYVAPTEEPTALEGGPSAAVEPEPTSGIQIPQARIDLEDQTERMEQGQEALKGVTEGALEDLAGYEPERDIGYKGYDEEKLKEESGLESGSSYITPEATVAGQLETLLDADSAYMTNARRRAQEQAASLGLLGSSMAVGASERAAIEAARPIAEADAKTYATAQLKEQEAYNQISTDKANSDLSGAYREHVYSIDMAKAEAQAAFNQISESAKMQGNMVLETTMTEIKSTWDAEVQGSLKNLEAQLTMMTQQQEISAREREYASTQASSVMAAAYGTISELMGNADFMAGYKDDPEKLTGVFNNFIDLAKNQVEFIGATAGLGDEYFAPDGYAGLIGEWTTDLGGYKPPA